MAVKATETPGILDMHGKRYLTVALRVTLFREKYKALEGWALEPEIVRDDPELIRVRAVIRNPDGAVVAVGHAQTVGGACKKDKALEKTETTAIGRALAALEFIGEEYASADEIASFFAGQQEERSIPPALREAREQLSQPKPGRESPVPAGISPAEFWAAVTELHHEPFIRLYFARNNKGNPDTWTDQVRAKALTWLGTDEAGDKLDAWAEETERRIDDLVQSIRLRPPEEPGDTSVQGRAWLAARPAYLSALAANELDPVRVLAWARVVVDSYPWGWTPERLASWPADLEAGRLPLISVARGAE